MTPKCAEDDTESASKPGGLRDAESPDKHYLGVPYLGPDLATIEIPAAPQKRMEQGGLQESLLMHSKMSRLFTRRQAQRSCRPSTSYALGVKTTNRT